MRLIRQHEHGLLSGELAMAWRGTSGADPLHEALVLATSLHDLAWRELDAEPRWDPETGRPHDFLTFPSEAKYRAAVEGIDRVAELHPYAAVLVSLHYSTMGSPRRPVEFEEAEEERRLELLDELEDEAPGPRQIRRDLDHLRLFDNLSLFVCLTPPGADPTSRPDWLTPDRFRIPGEGRALEPAWRGPEALSLAPFPFEGNDLELDLGYRDLPPGPFESEDALKEAWHAAEEETLRIRLTGTREPASDPGPDGRRE